MIRITRLTAFAVLTLTAAIAICAAAAPALGVVPGGTNIIHVPMSWCAVNGSPAASAPNILSEGATVPDTTTEAVLWRRHERPTDNIFMPQGAAISLRSAINATSGTFTFPRINDTVITPPVTMPADVIQNTNEAAGLVSACEQSYEALGRQGIGITAVNINLWRAADNSYPGQTGLAGCQFIGQAGSPCTSSFWIVVADNHWFYPTVPAAQRTIPGFGVPLADPFDQLVGHETGHALGLNQGFDAYVNGHRQNPTALMNPIAVDNTGDGRVDNIGLNAAEIAQMRATALNVGGREIDPPGTFTPDPSLIMRRFDGPRNSALPGYLDVAAVAATLNRSTGRLDLEQRLSGLLPCRSRNAVEYLYLSDLDNAQRTGASPAALRRIGVHTTARGTDLVARLTVTGGSRRGRDFRTCRARVRAWVVRRGAIVRLRPSRVDARIGTMRVFEPDYPIPSTTGGGVGAVSRSRDIFNSIIFRVSNTALPIRIRANAPFRLAASTLTGRRERDRLGRTARGQTFELVQPRFPHCFPAARGQAGGAVDVRFDGLRPNREVHALIGPNEVVRGVLADEAGNGTVRLPIPLGTRPGPHLVTIGHDGLALTADCTLTVTG